MTDEEARILAWTLLGEAAGEGGLGMTAVAHVIRNRAESGRFPSNPASVALQQSSSGTHQFSTWNALTNGGNIPRARFPVGSAKFDEALAIVNKVFSEKPGNDPTLGATHYYSPQGMAGGAAPYWWNSEAPLGGVKVGNHIFAKKRDQNSPIPVDRPVRFGDNGSMPTKGQLEVFRTGAPLRLPDIGSPKDQVKPAKMSVQMQEARLNPEGAAGRTTTMIFDPISGSLVPKSASVRQVLREAQAEQGAARGTVAKQPAKVVQRVAGFAVPRGTEGVASIDRARTLADAGSSFVERAVVKKPTAPKPAQTQFAQPVAQPAGSINPVKDESRLPATGALVPPGTVQSGGLSRDAVAARAAGTRAAVQPAPKPPAPVQLPPVVAPRPPTLRVVVEGSNPVSNMIASGRPPRTGGQTSLVQQAKNDLGLSSQEAYDYVNARSAQEARERSSNPKAASTRAGLAETFGFD